MDITITGRSFSLDNSLKEYIYKRLGKVERLYSRISKCEVILEEEKFRKNAEVILHLKRTRIVAKETSTDMYASIDNAAESIKKQLRRLRGKVFSKRRKVIMDRIMNPVNYFRNSEDEIFPSEEENFTESDFTEKRQ